MAITNSNKRYGFMAGCSLSSSCPEAVYMTMKYLKSRLPSISAIQKCCGQPTLDMGQAELFERRFFSLENDMRSLEIDEMIVACQNCKRILDEYSSIKTLSLWEVLPEIGIPEEQKGKGADSDIVFTVHDSCATRDEKAIHDGIRWLLDELGYKYVESDYSREKTLCCGAGGMCASVNPEISRKFMEHRLETLPEKNVVVYCATCKSYLSQGDANVWHVLDLLWGPVVQMGDSAPENVLAKPANAWLNRYKSKTKINSLYR